MYDSHSNEGRVCSAGTGVCLCDFITLHANFKRGWLRRWSEAGRRRGGSREREREHVREMDRVREGEEGGERWCDDRAAGAVFVHASAGKLITRWSLTPLKC